MERYDVLIVGAGPAGATAGLLLARAGLSVVIVERGKAPGSKNVSGGLLYTQPILDIFPDIWEEAPLERAITNHQIVLLSQDASAALDFRSSAAVLPPYNCFSVLRAKFDPWLAGKAEEAGAMVIPGITVDSLLTEGNRVVGIQAGADQLGANVTIIADGSRSLLLKQAGLRDDFPARDVSLGIKEIIRLPKEIIEERFQCTLDTGAAYTTVGAMEGIAGGGFLYTNKDSLSVGVVVKVQALAESKLQPHQVLEAFKSHPTIARLVAGGTTAEYSAQLVHRGVYGLPASLLGDGFLTIGSAARLMLNNIATLRGMDFAILSAKAAAQAVRKAHAKGDFGRAGLASYETDLKGTAIDKDWHTFRNMPALMDNPRIFSTYPDLLCEVIEDLFTPAATPAVKPFRNLQTKMEGKMTLAELAKDAWQAAKGLLF